MCVGGSALSLIAALLVPVWLVNYFRYNVKNFNLNFILHSGIVELEWKMKPINILVVVFYLFYHRVPIATLLFHLAGILIFDFDSPG